MKKHIVGENGIHYTLGKDGFYYPDLKLPEETEHPIGKYGWMKCEYLKNHHKARYMNLLLSGELNEYLHCVDEKCDQMLELLIQQMKVNQGVTEQMKAEKPMLWVGLMNNIRHAAEEFILKEIVYC
ncbi:MAG: TnpV protein [Lachnospiraceae bacterium]|nr:TnpV protein [Lachnospiraceae bacterium]